MALWKPNAMRVMTLILVLTDSMRPLDKSVVEGGVDGGQVLADFLAEGDVFGDAAAGGPFQPVGECPLALLRP